MRPTHLEHPLFKNLEAVPILLIVVTCLLCARPDILLWIQVWRITWPLWQTRKANFGKHENAEIEKPTKQEVERSKIIKVQK